MLMTGMTMRWMGLLLLAGSVPAFGAGDLVLPTGDAPRPLTPPHFPDRMHVFIWRNWECVDLDRMAAVLGTTEDAVREIGQSMGLPPHRPIRKLQKQRGYISVIRRNWHLLPYEQLLTLLGWDADRLAYALKEDDFLYIKLGRHKPAAEPLRYEPPTDAAKQRAAEIKAVVEKHFGDRTAEPMEPRFAFVRELSTPLPPDQVVTRSPGDEPIRFLYSYFAVYGDPLLDPELDPYPDGLLQRLAAQGVNGVWLHTVLRDLAPSSQFPEFGEKHEQRLANLRVMVERAQRYGIRIYLYMNEPRGMPPGFFDRHADIKGAPDGVDVAMCTSVPVVREYVRDSLAYVFKNVPGLGGVFTITMSENLTNCFSRNGQGGCPRCSKRTAPEVIAEINNVIAEGVRAGSPDAAVIVWDWVWANDWVEPIVEKLPKDVYLMSVSEWDLPITRGGVETVAGEYSISSVGPGPRATRNWRIAQEHGLKTIAKVQVSCTWELSVVPYIPAMDLVAEHLDHLRESGISGLMLSWTLGGFPSPNLRLVSEFAPGSAGQREQVLEGLAVQRFGAAGAADGREAWRRFSRAFAEYPFHIGQLYGSPAQTGPSNLLYTEPTGYHASMVGFPYDAVEQWCAVYPAEVFASQFEKVAAGWKEGIESLKQARDKADGDEKQHAIEDLRVAEAAYTHFLAIANQTRFTVARNALKTGSLSPEQRKAHFDTIRRTAESEIELASRLFDLTRADGRIGFEATNHYNYYPLDLVEKVINCRYILDAWVPAQSNADGG